MDLPSAPPIESKSFFAAFRDTPWDGQHLDPGQVFGVGCRATMLASASRRMIAGFIERTPPPAYSRSPAASRQMDLILGDASEFSPEQAATPMANAAMVRMNVETESVDALASIIGLPPLFLYEDTRQSVLTSDPFCLAALLPSGLKFDEEGVLDLCSYGFTIGHRTLYRHVRLVPGGVSLSIRGGRSEVKQAWTFAAADGHLDWKAYAEQQMEAFSRVLGRMNLKDSFLSLTAGLDTRTIFAALLSMKRPIPAFTLSGEFPSLDARTARVLCRAYGVQHQIVPLDDEFLRRLPEHTTDASRLSGGLASLGQAHQVYLYRALPHAYFGRVSGNLGNQLGRKGVERVSMRAADPAILSSDLRQQIALRPKFAWAGSQADGVALDSCQFLFQQEFTFTQLANYMIGDSFAVQQSPYASRDLIGMCHRRPAGSEAAQMSPFRIRLRDLRHRFLGEPKMYSFQRQLIQRAGGFAASYPINWGWRAKGGVSLPGTFRGFLTILDAYTERAGWDYGIPGRVLRSLQITGLHEHRKPKRWFRESLRDFVRDSLGSKEVEACGLLDRAGIARMLDAHFEGKASHHHALVLALDLALAAKIFRARVE